MKKRAMKKWIPYGFYCYGRIKKVNNGRVFTTGMCRNYVYSHTINDAIIAPKELGSTETMKIPCKRKIYKCRYLGVTTLDDICLADDCKICGIKEPTAQGNQGELRSIV